MTSPRVSSAKRLAALLLVLLLALSALACSKGETNTYQAQFDLGTRFLSDGNYEEAVIAFQAAIGIEPKNHEAYLSLSDAYLAMGDTDSAIAVLVDALVVIDNVVLDDGTNLRSRLESLVSPSLIVTDQASLDALAENAEAKTSRCVFITELDITDLSPLQNLTELEYIFLNYTEVRSLEPLRGLTSLRALDAPGNRITDIDALRELSNLTRLDLYDNEITDIGALGGLTGLKKLSLGGNNIRNFSPLAGLTGLTELLLQASELDDIDMLRGLTELECLLLFDNNITDIDALRGLTHLTYLDLEENEQLTQQQIDDLQAQLPNCEILF